jgi:RsiW-degrading membrane proteinase PrsW (M82 family)
MLETTVSLLPVFVFLAGLIFLDSYKLVKPGSVVTAIILGCASALLLVWLARFEILPADRPFYPRYVAPVIEEVLKGVFLGYFIRTKKIGFMVDAAIYGFGVGAGFSFIENIQYLQLLKEPNLFLWIIRGFGTAIMHGGATALLGVVSKNLSDRFSSERLLVFAPGLFLAIIIHSSYNHFFFSPEASTAIILIALPSVFLFVFNRSEKSTRHWLGVGFDTDMELLQMITTGEISETKVGKYLKSLKERFAGEIIADMLCLLRLHLELSLRAKGILLMRQAGFKPPIGPEIKEKFAELRYLERSIGKTGQLAIHPFLHTSSRDLWQLYMLEKT